MLHPNRSWEAESYRFGFNGVEKENDVTVTGGIAMADFRMYDARVGRWWGVDKIVKVHESPYVAFFNNPINFADPSGLNGIYQPGAGEEMGGGAESTDWRSLGESKPTGKKKDTSKKKVTPTPDNSTISSPTFDPSYGPLKAWSDFNNSNGHSGLKRFPILGPINLGMLSNGTYTTLDNTGLFFGNLAKRMFRLDTPLRHINGDVANPNEIYYASVDTWINIWTSFIGGSAINTELQATKVEVQAVKAEVQTVAKAEVKAVKTEMQSVKTEVQSVADRAAIRAAQYSDGWANGSLKQVIEKFAPESTGVKTLSGKTLYTNNQTGIQVVVDDTGNYFRIENTQLSGKRRYLDLDGNIPNKGTSGFRA